jgi:hypothetical protein
MNLAQVKIAGLNVENIMLVRSAIVSGEAESIVAVIAEVLVIRETGHK